MLTALVSTITYSWVFLLKKCESHFFSKNISIYAIFNYPSLNDSLTNDISYEQLGPDGPHQEKKCLLNMPRFRSSMQKVSSLPLLTIHTFFSIPLVDSEGPDQTAQMLIRVFTVGICSKTRFPKTAQIICYLCLQGL